MSMMLHMCPKCEKRLGNHHNLSPHKKNCQSVKSARLDDSNTSVAEQKRPSYLDGSKTPPTDLKIQTLINGIINGSLQML